MENSLRPCIEIELGGAMRRLQYNMNSIAELEGVTDLPVISAGAGLFQHIKALGSPGIRYTRALLWASLLHSEPTITLIQAGELISINNLEQVSQAIDGALRLFFRQQGLLLPEPDEKKTLLT